MPFSNIPTTSILTYGLDYYYWPCISGESFPPTLSASGGSATSTYSASTYYPGISLLAQGAANASAVSTWPVMPWANPRTNAINGFELSFNLWIQPFSGFETNFQFGIKMASDALNTNPALIFGATATGVNAVLKAQIATNNFGAAGPATSITRFLGPGLNPAWFAVTFSYDYTTQLASAVVDDQTVEWTNHTFTGAAGTPRASMTTGGSNTTNQAYVSSLRLDFN
jgi:hypothetical protein